MEQRNTGLKWLREQQTDCSGVVYFADDDNKFDLRVFAEVRAVYVHVCCVCVCVSCVSCVCVSCVCVCVCMLHACLRVCVCVCVRKF